MKKNKSVNISFEEHDVRFFVGEEHEVMCIETKDIDGGNKTTLYLDKDEATMLASEILKFLED